MRWAAIAATVAAGSTLAPAALADVRVHCERLAAEQAPELTARAELTLVAAERPLPRRVVMRCDEVSAWLEWHGDELELLRIDESAGIVEGAIRALEAHLRRAPPASPQPAVARATEPAPATPAASPATTESTAQPFVDEGRPPWPAHLLGAPGGAGGNVAFEHAGSGRWFSGPQLDVGVSPAAHWSIVGTEGVRTVLAEPGAASLIGLRVGVAYGAPYAPDDTFGAVALGGWEWLYDDDSLSHAPVGTLGLRVAANVDSVAIWFGLDGSARARRLEVGDRDDRYSLPALTLAATVGGFVHAYAP